MTPTDPPAKGRDAWGLLALDLTGEVVLGLLGLAVAVAWVLVATTHLHDGSRLTNADGVWLALAYATNHGEFYPPVFDGEHFGTTRYMPLPFLLTAALERFNGDYVGSAKMLSFGYMGFLIAALFAALRTAGCRWGLSVALAAAVLLTDPGWETAVNARNDSLAPALQLAALALVAGRGGRASTVAAGVLCATAVMAKFSALWAAAAIVLWLLAVDRRRLVGFAAAYGASLAAMLGLALALSRGRLLECLVRFGFAGYQSGQATESGARLLKGVFVTETCLLKHLPFTMMLVPVVLFGLGLAARRRRLSLGQLALLIGFPAAVVQIGSRGGWCNHLLDFTALALLATGEVWVLTDPRRADASDPRPPDQPLRPGFPPRSALQVLIAIVVGFSMIDTIRTEFLVTTVRAEWRQRQRGTVDPEYDLNAFADEMKGYPRVYSQDSLVDVLLDREPTVVDSFWLSDLEHTNPDWIDRLIARFRAREFDRVVLLKRDVTPEGEMDLFGDRVAAAVEENYTFDHKTQRFYIFKPKPTGP